MRKNDGDPRVMIRLTNYGSQFKAVTFRHMQVHQDKFRLKAGKYLQSFHWLGNYTGLHPGLHQYQGRVGGLLDIIINSQYPVGR
jgi:hypothetical protein